MKAKTIYNHKKRYLSRSVVGMLTVLVVDFKMTKTEAKATINGWIESKEIKPTHTKDNHYILCKT